MSVAPLRHRVDPARWSTRVRVLLLEACGLGALLLGLLAQRPLWLQLRRDADTTALQAEAIRARQQLAAARADTAALAVQLAGWYRARRQLTAASWMPLLQQRVAAAGLQLEAIAPVRSDDGFEVELALLGGRAQLLDFLDAVSAELDTVRVEHQQLDVRADGSLRLQARWRLALGDSAADAPAAVRPASTPPVVTPPARLAGRLRVGEHAETVWLQGGQWVHRPCRRSGEAAGRDGRGPDCAGARGG